MAKSYNIKVEVEILLQADMNSINNGWDSAKRAETPYFHCGPSGQNENERKRQTRKKTPQKPKKKTHEND